MCLNIYMEIVLCLNVDCYIEGGDICFLFEIFFFLVEFWGMNVYVRMYVFFKLMEIFGVDIYFFCVLISDIEGI